MPANSKKNNKLSSLIEQYAATGQSSMLQLMMLAGVNPNLKGKDQRTLAHHAAIHAVMTGNASAIRKLADYGGCMHVKDAFGNSPLDILRARPSLYTEINKAILRGVGNSGLKDSNTVSGKRTLSEKSNKNQRTLKKLRGGGRRAKPLLVPHNIRDRQERTNNIEAEDGQRVLKIRAGSG